MTATIQSCHGILPLTRRSRETLCSDFVSFVLDACDTGLFGALSSASVLVVVMVLIEDLPVHGCGSLHYQSTAFARRWFDKRMGRDGEFACELTKPGYK